MTSRPPTAPRPCGRPLRAAGVLALGLLGLGLAGPAAPPLLGQQASPQVAIQAAEERYAEAHAAWDAVRERRDAALRNHEILVDRHTAARASGDGERAEVAMSHVHHQGMQITRLEQELQAVADPLSEAARDLLAAIDAREEEILDVLEGTLPSDVRAELNEELVRLRARYREVEQEAGSDASTQARVLPDLAIGPRDGPQELRAKAGIMESWADQYATVLDAVDREIRLREQMIQQERGREDLMAGISRFGDDRLVGGGIVGPERDPAAASDGDDDLPLLEELSLPEQLARLRDYREQITGWRDEALAQAEIFRARAEGGPG